MTRFYHRLRPGRRRPLKRQHLGLNATLFFQVNTLLLRNTSVSNVLSGGAISIPSHVHDELPMGLMVWSITMRDDSVLNIAFHVEQSLRKH